MDDTQNPKVLPRLGVPRRCDLEKFDDAVHRAADEHGCTYAEAFEIIRSAIQIALQNGARFYCGEGENFRTPVTLLTLDKLRERLALMSDDFYEDRLEYLCNPPPIYASHADLNRLIEIAFDPQSPVTPEPPEATDCTTWIDRFPIWGRCTRLHQNQAALLLAGIDPAEVEDWEHAKRLDRRGWQEAHQWATAIDDAIEANQLLRDKDYKINIKELMQWVNNKNASPSEEPCFWLTESLWQEKESATEKRNRELTDENAKLRAQLKDAQEQAAMLSAVLDANRCDHPQELAIALRGWWETFGLDRPQRGVSAKQVLRNWMEKNHPDCPAGARDRITTVANPNKRGGAPKTPT